MEFYKQDLVGQLTPAVVSPGAERRPVWWCFAQLGIRLGLECLPPGLDADRSSDDEVVDALAGSSGSMLRDAVHGIIADRPDPWVTQRVLPGGRWRVAPPDLCAALRELPEPPPLALIPGRQLRTMNSALRDVASVGERTESVGIHVSPTDAERGGVMDGDQVRVCSAHGEVTGVAAVDPDLREGALWIPHGWLAPDLGRLTSAHHDIDPLTGMVLQSGVGVSIERVPPSTTPPA